MMFDTNASIRFLLKEMDPSECLLFERELERNPDLLIELETLRNTLSRLDGAPRISAPDGVLDNVRFQANAFSASQRRKAARTRLLQAAAVLTLAAVPSIYLASTSWDSGVAADSADRQSVEGPSSPWVDRNETLRLADPSFSETARAFGAQTGPPSSQTVKLLSPANTSLTASGHQTPEGSDGIAGSTGTASDSIYEASMRKLRPLTGREAPQSAPTQLQLTRSRQR
jgi:hypothetical protein